MERELSEIHTVRDAVHGVYSSYVRAKEYVVGRPDREVRRPKWTKQLLRELGSPDEATFNVAVTGSKGKGSHSIFLACMLERMGLRVGLFTGPHLVDFMERFRLDGRVMPEDTFVSLTKRALLVTESFELNPDEYCGPVGILAAVGARWFTDERADVCVFECGRGALHDDVNQVRHQGAVMTPVFMEHVSQLGPTLADIGVEKAGVITSDTKFVIAHPQAREVSRTLMQRAHVAEASLSTLGSDFDFAIDPIDDSESCILTLREHTEPQVKLVFPTAYASMARNAAVSLRAAVEVWKQLKDRDAAPSQIDLRDVVLPGRLHVVRRRPFTLVDGTIHADSVPLVLDFLESLMRRNVLKPARIGVVLGLPSDKDGAGVIGRLARVADWFIVARAHNPTLKFSDEWYTLAKTMGLDVTPVANIEEAGPLADGRLSGDDVLLVLGTQSFVADSLVYYGADSRSIWR